LEDCFAIDQFIEILYGDAQLHPKIPKSRNQQSISDLETVRF